MPYTRINSKLQSLFIESKKIALIYCFFSQYLENCLWSIQSSYKKMTNEKEGKNLTIKYQKKIGFEPVNCF